MERQDHLYCKIFAEWLNPLPQRRRLRKAVYWKERHRSKRSLYRNRTARLGAQLRSARFYNSVNALSGRVRQPKGNSKTPSDRRYRRSAEVSSQNSSDRLSVRTGLPTFQKDQRLSDSRYSGL
jgi:hypothetical protein